MARPKLILRRLAPRAYEWVCGTMKWPIGYGWTRWGNIPIGPAAFVHSAVLTREGYWVDGELISKDVFPKGATP